MSSYVLRCYIKGDNKPFPVVVPPTLPIGLLKEMINDRHSNLLREVDASSLILSKVNVVYDTVIDEVLNGKYQPDEQQLLANAMSPISELWPEPPLNGYLHIYVSLPVVGSPIVNVGDDKPVDLNFVKEYEKIFIKVKEWGAFDDSDIQRNGLCSHRRGTQTPEFVAEFERKLVSKPCPAPDAYHIYNGITDRQVLEEYFEPLISAVEGQSPVASTLENESHRHAGYFEVLHLASIAAYDWKRYWSGELGKSLEERAMNTIFLDQFTVQPSEMTTVLPSNQSWPFKLIMKRENRQDKQGELRLFEPRSDLLILKSGLPRLLVEVNSRPRKKWPEDLIRMLLLGSAIVRLANNVLQEFMENRNFVLFTTYIWDQGDATRYLLYQDPDSSEVYYKIANCSLNTPVARAAFIRQLYNVREGLEQENENQVTKEEIEMLQEKVQQHGEYYHLKSFHTKNTKDTGNNTGNKRKRPNGDDNQRAVDCEELGKHGYKVKPPAEDIVDEKGGVVKVLSRSKMVKSHIFNVYQRSNPSKRFIAKKVHKRSNELEFLKYLNALHLKSEHIISLHESFQTQSTSWAIIPELDTVADYVLFEPYRLYGKVAQVCWGLIEGVACLHKLCISHRDIKPENLVVDREFCLKIIDFDVSMRVEDENEVVEGQCGTKGWMAPEIEEKSMYSPIKADRWSTGKVLFYLLDLEEDTDLRAIARKLTAYNPDRRLSLQVTSSLLDVVNVASVAVEKVASRYLQDTVEADRENMDTNGEYARTPRMKKQKVSAPDRMVLGDLRQ